MTICRAGFPHPILMNKNFKLYRPGKISETFKETNVSHFFFFPQHGKIFNARRRDSHSPSHLPKHRAGENFRPARFESRQSSSPLDMISEEASGPCAQGQEPLVVPSPEAVSPNRAGPWKPCRGPWHRLGHCRGSLVQHASREALAASASQCLAGDVSPGCCRSVQPPPSSRSPQRPRLATAVCTTSSLRAWSPDGNSATGNS